ncbi:MAG: TlpA disulfide reductase family protein [Kofleriaceae bacterium]
MAPTAPPAPASPARPGRTRALVTGGLALGTAAALAILFLRMVGPAVAREARAACAGLRPEPTAPARGPAGAPGCPLPQPAPDFTVTAHDGRQVRLADFRGKVVLLNFWASWCGVCKSEKPALDGVARELAGGDDFEVVTLASDADWNKVLMAMAIAQAPRKVPERFRRVSPPPDEPTREEALAAYAAAMPSGAPYQVYLDPPAGDGNIGAVANRWGTQAVPESFLIDREGRVRYYFVNKRDWRSSVAQTCLRSVIAE